MAVARSVWFAVRRAWRWRRDAEAPSANPVLAVHAGAPTDAEPLSDHERRALAAWRRATSQTIPADEAKRRLLEDEASEAGAG